jgi:Tol biopolymer transport system component
VTVHAGGAVQERILFFSVFDQGEDHPRSNLFTMRLDGSDRTNLTRSDMFEVDPVWSPDRSQIAFEATIRGSGCSNLFVMNSDGSGRRQLTESPRGSFATFPTWSHDGCQLAFSTDPVVIEPEGIHGADVPPSVYLIDVDGGSARPLGDGLMPAWSSDGRSIVYAAEGLFRLDLAKNSD